jgi:hypothetical protein
MLSVFTGGASCSRTGCRREQAADGTLIVAKFNWPAGLAIDGNDFYVADMGAGYIRKISGAVVSTIYQPMNKPISVAVSPPFRATSMSSTGRNTELYVAEMQGKCISKLTPNAAGGFAKIQFANLNTYNPQSVAVQRKVETVRTWTKSVTVNLLPMTQHWKEEVAYDYVYYSNDFGQVIRKIIEKGRDSYVYSTTK